MDAMTFYKELTMRMLKLGKNSMLLRWFIKFLSDRLKVSKVFKGLDVVVRFGLGVMFFATGYHFLRRILAQWRRKKYQKNEGSEQH